MKKLLFTLSVFLSFPSLVLAATAGGSCNGVFPGLEGKGICRYLCTTINATGAVSSTTCPAVEVPVKNPKHVTVRIYSPTATNCTFTTGGDIIALMKSGDSPSAGYRPIYGTLDSDAVTLELRFSGPIDPYIAMSGMVTAGTCTTTNALDVIGIFYEEPVL